MNEPERHPAEGAGSCLEGFIEAVDLASRILTHEAVARNWEVASEVPGFSVGGLAAHLYAAVRRLEVALDLTLPASPTMVGIEAFYGANRVESIEDLTHGIHLAIRDDAEGRASYGPQSVIGRFGELLVRLRLDPRLKEGLLDRPVPVLQVPNGVTPLHVYLASRVVELVVHSDDLNVSVGLPPLAIPAKAASVAIGVLLQLARARAGDLSVVRAFARSERGDPDGLRVL